MITQDGGSPQLNGGNDGSHLVCQQQQQSLSNPSVCNGATYPSTDCKSLPHKLNKTKSLQKKISACNRPCDLEIKPTDGGLVITCSAGYYELFKDAIVPYVEESSQLIFKAKDKKQKDLSAAVQSSSHAINFRNGIPCCVINMYNTTSRILINGKSATKFVKDHMPQINSYIGAKLQSMNCTVAEINQFLLLALEEATATDQSKQPLRKGDTASKNKKQSQSKGKRFTRKKLSDNQAELLLAEEDLTHCPICHKDADGDTILCDICLLWVHKECEGMSPTAFKLIEGSKQYTCTLCASLKEGIDQNSHSETKNDQEVEVHPPPPQAH